MDSKFIIQFRNVINNCSNRFLIDELVYLEELRFKEIQTFNKVLDIIEKDNIPTYLSILKENLNRAIELYNYSKSSLVISKNEIEIRNLKQLLTIFDDYIKNLFELILIFFPEVLDSEQKIHLMREYIPEGNKHRREFEQKQNRKKGPKKANRVFKDYFNHTTIKRFIPFIADMRKEYKNRSSEDCFLMVYILVKEGILKKDSVCTGYLNPFLNELRKGFPNTGSRHNFEKHLQYYDGLKESVFLTNNDIAKQNKLSIHKELVKSILEPHRNK